jgi:hypothetical protein
MIYTHVLQSSAAGTASPLDGLMLATASSSDGAWEGDDDIANANPIVPRSPFRAREPAFPCYHPSRLTPSFTAAATSAS